MADAFIKLYNKMLKWEWYDNINACRLFIHCLLKANWQPTKWQGVELQPGQFVTSLTKLSDETSLTIRQVRDNLNRLISTGELTSKTTNKYRIITVNNWSDYQGYDKQNGKQMTNKPSVKRQTNDKQMTGKPTTEEEYKDYKDNKTILTILTDSSSFSKDIQKIVEMWNMLSEFGIQSVKKITSGSKRETQLKARLKQFSLEDFTEAIEQIRQSDFLQGKNKTGWMITFDWFILPSNFTKVLEGNYNNKKGETNNGNTKVGIEHGSGNEERDREVDEIIKRINSGESDNDDERLWD